MKRDPALRPAMDALIDDVRAASATQDIAHGISHGQRVWRNARLVGEYAERDEGWVVDGDVVKLAAFLFSIAPRTEDPMEDVRQASAQAETLLRKHGLSHLVWPVGQTILNSSYRLRREAGTFEARVLADARRLDALGAIGIARCVSTGTLKGAAAFYDLEDPLAVHRPLDEERFVLDHFRTRLFRMSEAMYSRYGRVEGKRRTRVLRAFYDALLKEAGYMLDSDAQ